MALFRLVVDAWGFFLDDWFYHLNGTTPWSVHSVLFISLETLA